MLRAPSLALVLLLLAPLLQGCIGDEPTIALLVADGSDRGARVVDVERFTERVEATCDECRVTVLDAEGDEGVQNSQVRQAEAAAADVVVLQPVDPGALTSLGGRDLPLVSLGALLPGSDRYVGLEDGEVPVQDGSDLQAARNLVLGDEKSMVFVPVGAMSDQAADVAVALLAGNPLPGGQDVDGVQSWLFRDQEVTLDNLTSVLVAQDVVRLDDLCDGSTAKRCEKLGLR